MFVFVFGHSKYSLLVGVDPFKIVLIHLSKNIAFRGYKQLQCTIMKMPMYEDIQFGFMIIVK